MVATIPSRQKEQLSRAYISALVARGGYAVATWDVDKDGVDVTLRDGGVSVDLQLKCTTSPKKVAEGYSYKLDTPTYDKLRQRDRSAPGYLALMIAPPNIEEWLTCEPKRLLIACHAYWAQLQDRDDPADGKSKSINLPEAQRFDTNTLVQMFAFSREMIKRAG